MVKIFEGVGHLDSFGVFGGNTLASVMLQGATEAPPIFTAEVPRFPHANGSFVTLGVCGHIFGPMPKNIMESNDCTKLFVTHLDWCVFKRTCECL